MRRWVAFYVGCLDRGVIVSFRRGQRHVLLSYVTRARRLSRKWLRRDDVTVFTALQQGVLASLIAEDMTGALELGQLLLDLVTDQLSQGLGVPELPETLHEILAATKDYEGIKERLQRIAESARRTPGRAVTLFRALRGLAHVARHAGRSTDEEPVVRETVALAERLYGPTAPQWFQCAFELIGALVANGRVDEALRLGNRMLEVVNTQDDAGFLGRANIAIEVAQLHLLGGQDYMGAKELLLATDDLLGAAAPGRSAADRRDRREWFARQFISWMLSLYRDLKRIGDDSVEESLQTRLDSFVGNLELSDLVEYKLGLAQAFLEQHLGQEPHFPGDSDLSFLDTLFAGLFQDLDEEGLDESEAKLSWLDGLDTKKDLDQKPRDSDPPAVAEAMLRSNVAQRTSLLGAAHPSTARAHFDLARHLYGQRQLAECEHHLRDAIAIWRETGGAEIAYLHALQALAAVCQASGRGTEAWDHLSAGIALEERMIAHTISFTSERETSAFIRSLDETYYQSLSVAVQLAGSSPSVTRQAFALVLRRKALVGRSQLAQWKSALEHEHPLARRVTEARRQIGDRLMAGAEEGSEEIAALHRRREKLEAELALEVGPSYLPEALAPVNLEEVAGALPAGSALVELVRYETSSDAFGFGSSYLDRRYLAFVLPAADPGNLQLIDLGPARAIESAVYALWQTVSGWREPSRGRDLPHAVAGSPDFATRLHETLVRPLFDPLQAMTRLFISPDGDLSLLPFELLPCGDGQLLIDRSCISYLASGRDVLRFAVPLSHQPGPAVVVAGPDFDLGQTSGAGSGGRGFVPLDFASAEGEQIAKLLGVELWTGSAAIEHRLLEVRSPHVLHLATHGFLFDSEYGSAAVGRLKLAGLWRHPLLQSGLALAGANTWLRGGQPPPEAGDGLLTAAEVATLDLVDTELVVLSACNTGLGQVEPGEGVFGLRRSFALAGARTLVVSLWQVPDLKTSRLMAAFYGNLLGGQGRAEALRQAKLEQRRRGVPAIAWAAFICQGDPGPLQVPLAARAGVHP